MSKKTKNPIVRNPRPLKPEIVKHDGFPVAKDGSNAEYISIVMKFNTLPPIDLTDTEQVRDRINTYFDICFKSDFKPTVSSLASVLGLNRRELYGLLVQDANRFNYLVSKINDDTLYLIKKAYGSMEQLWESYMLNGKINPVSGIFLGKNHYGYVDKVDYVVQAKPTMSEDDLLDRYLEMKDD